MRRFWILTLWSLVVMVPFVACQGYAADEKYTFIDVAKVFDEYQKTKDQDKILQEEGEKKEKERQVIVDAIRKMKDELELLSDDAKKTKQEEMNKKVRELQDFDLETRRELGEKRRKIVQEIFNDIDQVVQGFGKRKKLDYILNDKALLYYRTDLDITSEILKELNNNYKKK